MYPSVDTKETLSNLPFRQVVDQSGDHVMWHTSRGDRTLFGDEAAVVRISIESMIDALQIYLEEEIDNQEVGDDARIDCQTGIAVYDALTISQRIALLHDVATYLLTDTTDVLPLSAELEAAIAAIFQEVRDQVSIEIDFPTINNPMGGSTWRSLVRRAYASICVHHQAGFDDGPGDEAIPQVSCRDMHPWEFLIESLSEAILWDRDFEMGDSFLDDDPRISHHRRRLLGIEDDYFTSIARDPRPDEVHQLVSRTRAIVRAKPR